MGACKRKPILILYKGGNSVKENFSFRRNNEKQTKTLPLASNPRKNQATEQFRVSQIRTENDSNPLEH